MHRFVWLSTALLLTAACSGSGASVGEAGGSGSLVLEGTTYALRGVAMTFEPGEEPWFRIEGESTGAKDEECLAGLGSGMGLYGDLPASVKQPIDLVGERLKVDFTGDGDDANFCFVGMGGLAGAEEAWVTIESVSGNRVTFSMSGTFTIYDQKGGEVLKSATARGTAVVRGVGEAS
ncbi:MAG TPA: hypothetical protein VF139_00255 [Candidatus Polarisedimenticolaceae bacterium]